MKQLHIETIMSWDNKDDPLIKDIEANLKILKKKKQ